MESKFNNRLKAIDRMIELDIQKSTGISYRNINKMVKQRLDEDKVISRRYRLALTFVLIIFISTVTIFALGNVDLLKYYFTGDSSSINDNIHRPETFIRTDDYVITLEQSLSDKYSSIIIISVEALNNEAQNDLNKDTFFFDSPIRLEGPFTSYGATDNGTKYDGTGKRYCYYEITGFDNTNMKPIKLYYDLYELVIPMGNKLDYVDLKPSLKVSKCGQKFTVTKVGLSNISLVYEYEPDDWISFSSNEQSFFPYSYPLDIFFRMDDGKVNTLSQLAEVSSRTINAASTNKNSGDHNMYVIYLRFKEVQDISKFISIIIEDTEYLLNSKDSPKKAYISKELRPTIIKPVYCYIDDDSGLLHLPLMGACEILGGSCEFNEEKNKVNISYRGKTLEIELGNEVFLNDNISLYNHHSLNFDKPIIMYNGEMLVSPDLLLEYFDVDTQILWKDKDRDLKSAKWLLIP